MYNTCIRIHNHISIYSGSWLQGLRAVRVRHPGAGTPEGVPGGTTGLLRPKYLEICRKTQQMCLFSQGVQFSQIFSEKNAARSWVLISYLHRWTSIYVYLCPEMAKMIAQRCKSGRKRKEYLFIMGVAFGRPLRRWAGRLRRPAHLCRYHYGYVLLYFSSRSCIFGLSSWLSLDINRHKWTFIDVNSL